MKTLLISALVLCAAGCFPYDPGPPPVVAPSDIFGIDVGTPLALPAATGYAIATSDGVSWVVSWHGDTANHHFTGQIYNGADISDVVATNLASGDSVTQSGPDEVDLDAVTDGSNVQTVTLDSSTQPLRFNLQIDGQPAIGNVVYTSLGVLSTVDVMPFGLVDSRSAAASLRQAPVAAIQKNTR